MKKLIYVFSLALVVFACKEEAPKDYVTLSGTITNPNSDSLIVAQRSILKTIKVAKDGTFSDTLKVEDGSYVLFDGAEQASVYLKNGYDLNITVDAKEFDETLTYTGNGAEPNNYLVSKGLLQEKVLDDKDLFLLEKPAFDSKIAEVKVSFENLLKESKYTDSLFIAQETKGIEGLTQYIAKDYDKQQYMAKNLAKGMASPKFADYENYKGGTTSLNDLKGKYVYVDVWATWCGPCKREIPFLQEVEKAYHGKNIEFVSISVDKEKDHETWKQMVADKELGGIQLYADKDWQSDFVQGYKINGIPRFILIDPKGNIVSANAPRPSSDDLKVLFDDLKI